ncbi:ribonuclease HII [Candidatus Cytomitobacter primus]|uniref:ribonuclease HII n=1 Tax=Candidatus Cytomitobacter primus TaxID=2066024 RepID=UPI00248233D2|nr:ribonuclease HII [Candidatus Cytomitobacter primus]
MYTDEVGYGAWAGPVVVCSVLSQEVANAQIKDSIRDSKSLTKNARYKLLHVIKQKHMFAIAWLHAVDIDKFGLRVATDKAIVQSWSILLSRYKLNVQTNLFGERLLDIVIDGKYIPKTEHNVKSIINGDKNNLMISYASIIAKETRDAYMCELHKIYKEYSWNSNVGYGTIKHRDAIAAYGVTKHHRKSYKPLQKYI